MNYQTKNVLLLLACNCNPLGALNTNPKYPVCSEKSCRCKRYVHGKHCDECKNGFFNLTLAHGDNGCERNQMLTFYLVF